MTDPPPVPPGPNLPPPSSRPTGSAPLPPAVSGPLPANAGPANAGPAASVLVHRVSKWFGDVVAVSDVSFALGPGVTALLGPNGAGKSTVLRIICGLTAPSQGEVAILGRSPRTHPDAARQIGLVPQQDGVFERQTALGFVRLAGVLQRLDDPTTAARAALGVVELDADSSQAVGTFSKGMRQRLKVAQALVHDPHVLILDEPLNGLDPRQRLHMIELFGRLGSEGRCVVVSSHVLDEVERFGSRILVIAHGRLAAEGDFRAIRNLMDDRPRRFSLRTDRPQDLGAHLLGWGLASAVEVRPDGQLLVETTDAPRLRRSLAPLARERAARVTEVEPLDEDLESVFRYLVGRG